MKKVGFLNCFSIILLFFCLAIDRVGAAVSTSKKQTRKKQTSKKQSRKTSKNSKSKKGESKKHAISNKRSADNEEIPKKLLENPEYNELSGNLKDLTNEKKKIEADLKNTKREVRKATRDINQVDARLNRLSTELYRTQKTLKRSRQEQIIIDRKLQDVKKEYDESYKQLQLRIRQLYKQSGHSALGLLVTSKNIGELAARKSILHLMASKDKALCTKLKQMKDDLKENKIRQKELCESIQQLVVLNAEQQEKMQQAREDKAAWLKNLQSEQDELERKFAELDAESSSIEMQIKKFQASQIQNDPEQLIHSGKFRMPTSGRLSSSFGIRRHPILKRRRLHNGQDIAAPHGTPIYAAGAGVVISSEYRRGYGNTVIIDHGKGFTTLYAHCSRLYANEGDKVAEGTKIAAVGTTGLSTGPHLHFEVRINGKPVNPVKYLK